jgi:hypothetical protein
MTTQSLQDVQSASQKQIQERLSYLVFAYPVIPCLALKNGTIVLRLEIRFVFTVLDTLKKSMAVMDVVQMRPPKERRNDGYRAVFTRS